MLRHASASRSSVTRSPVGCDARSHPHRRSARSEASVTDRGLREVVAGQTKVSDIDGQLGRLWYAGYDIADLAANSTFEEAVYLLHHAALPNRDELDELTEFLVDERDLSPLLKRM